MYTENQFSKINQEEEKVDIIGLFQKALSKWYLFLFFGVLGVSGAYVYTKNVQPFFEVQTTLLIQNEESGFNIGNVFDNQIFNPTNIKMINQIGVLGSYSLNKQVLENLNWKVIYYEKNFLSKIDLYKNSPFEVVLMEGRVNHPNIELNISFISEKKYLISVDDETLINGKKIKVSFESEGFYGTPFENKYYNFIINKDPSIENIAESEYSFIVTDLNTLIINNRENLVINILDESSDLIELKLTGDQPQRNADYLNELTSVYIKFGLEKKNRKSDNTVQFIDLQLSGVIDSLQLANTTFTNFRSRNQIIDLSQEGSLVVERLEQLETERTMANLRFDYYQNLLNYLDNAEKMEQMVVPSVVGITDPVLNTTVTKLSELYARRSTLSLTVTDINPALRALENEIVYTKKILDENLRNLISNTRVELQNFEVREQQMSRQLARLPKTEQDMVNIKRDFDINNELYTFLLQKRAEAAIAKASNVPEAQILDLARIETAIPVGLSKKVLLIMGLILGLAIPAIFIIAHEFLDKTISSKEEVERNTNISVLGGITHNKEKMDMPVIKYPKSPITESFRGLRTNLRYMLSDEGQKVIAVHSSMKGEGKTFVAVNLALIIAMTDKKVLLVGADMRKPRLHKLFNIPNNSGLSSYLIKKDDFSSVVLKTQVKNLSLVLSGPIPPNPAELIENNQFEKFLHLCRENFDYVILDNAPSFMVTDGILVSKKSDLNLFVLRINKTYKEHLKAINNIANNGMEHKIGLVINDIKSDKYGVYNTYKAAYS